MSLTSSTTFGLAAAPAWEYAAGTLIGGKYRLERMIGEGGMGAVWHASNVHLELPVALKLLHPEMRDRDTTARLLTEARVEARLDHPSIVRVFDYGETERGAAYIVMELLEGATLSEVLELHGTLPPIAAVGLLLPIIHGICAVHGAGVVHRDLKPHNIMVAQTGTQLRPTLLDFGIAKLRGEFSRKLTIEGNVLGSPAYMAPEQARGSLDVDERADIWALCVVLYELISGASPFDAGNQYSSLCAVVEREPPALTGAGCATLWPILKRGLAKDRQLRSASAHELGAALARWLIEQGETEDACGDSLVRAWSLVFDADQRSVAAKTRAHDVVIPEERAPDSAKASSRDAMRGERRMLIQAVCAFALAPALAVLLTAGQASPEYAAVPAASAQPMAAGIHPGVLTSTIAESSSQIAPPFSCESDVLWTSSSTPSATSASAGKPRRANAGRVVPRPAALEDVLGLKDPFR
ncbi:MAG TPA: serine/threonine-protein kinase [Polyangiales bacterium]|nr:serine/threonine-protein kinase [Polyangiales bacterium]